MKVGQNALDFIGNTHLVNLNVAENNVTVQAKCEYLNPSGSIKDRVALRLINEAEREGKLKPGGTVVESSTGNMGIALSMVCSVKRYNTIIYMPKGWAVDEKKRIMRAYGAKIVEVSPGKEIERELKGKSVHGGVVELLPRIKCLEAERKQKNTWWARQAINPYNAIAHEETTGKEILEQTHGRVDAFVAAVGTGGTLLGVGRALKKRNPDVKIYAVEPASSPLLKTAPQIQHYMEKYGIPGVRGWIVEEIKKLNIADETLLVSDRDAVGMANRLARERGLFVGMSSGASVYASMKLAEKMRGGNIVTILPDSRYRYLTVEHFVT